MDSYIVRIYRRNSSSPQNLVGLVELVEVDQEKSFTNFEELREILSRGQASMPAEKKTKNRKLIKPCSGHHPAKH